MRKTEMTEKQLQDRSLIIKTLAAAGWEEVTDNEVFEKGLWCDPEAAMEYENKTMSIELEYDAKDNSIYISIYEFSGKGIDLTIYYQDKLEEILKTIISFQNEISSENYRYHIRKVLQSNIPIYVGVDEKVFQLTDEEGDNVEIQG